MRISKHTTTIVAVHIGKDVRSTLIQCVLTDGTSFHLDPIRLPSLHEEVIHHEACAKLIEGKPSASYTLNSVTNHVGVHELNVTITEVTDDYSFHHTFERSQVLVVASEDLFKASANGETFVVDDISYTSQQLAGVMQGKPTAEVVLFFKRVGIPFEAKTVSEVFKQYNENPYFLVGRTLIHTTQVSTT